MKKVPMLILFVLLILASIIYAFWNKQTAQKTLIIKPIRMPIVIKEEEDVPNMAKSKKPSDILKQLQVATQTSKEKLQLSEDARANNVLSSLKQKVTLEIPKSKHIESITTIKVLPSQPNKIVKVTKRLKSKAKSKITKKRPLKTKPTVKKTIKLVAQKKTTPTTAQIAKVLTKAQTAKHLSREEEVALYKQKTAHGLEIVGTSKPFVLDEPTPLHPDEYYFEKTKVSKVNNTKNEPMKYVKKLGVVKVSDAYEVNFIVPRKIELAKEGIVSISTASIETDELKKLKFVNTLGVVEVSKDFETIEAKKYLP